MPRFQHNDLHVSVPEGWVDVTQVRLVGPAQGGLHPSVVITREVAKTGETAEDLAARYLPELHKALPGLAIVEEGPKSLGGTAGFLREFTASVEGRKVQQVQFYATLMGAPCVFTATYEPGDPFRFRPIAEKIFSSALQR